MVFVLINRAGQRIKELNGELTPAFAYASQAIKYAEHRLMKYYTVYDTDKNTNKQLLMQRGIITDERKL